jgi:hypothetical protein
MRQGTGGGPEAVRGIASLVVCLAAVLVSAHAGPPSVSSRPRPGPAPSEVAQIHSAIHREAVPASRRISALTVSVAGALAGTGSPARVAPRKNLIDTHLFGAMERAGVAHAPLSNDQEFCRRVHLDLIGRPPAPDQLLSFLADRRADKRDRLIDRLLSSEAWVDRWAYWLGDQFRNCANRSGEPAMRYFDGWIRQALREDRPYDQFVRELLTASAPSTNWAENAAPSNYLARWHVLGDSVTSDMFEDTADEILVNVGRNFLGVNYQCISCHDGAGHLEKLNLDLTARKRRDFWSMAAFFGRMRMRKVVYQDRFTITEDGSGYDPAAPSTVRILREGGDPVVPTFILTGEKADPDRPLRPQFARMLTGHPQFARATVNLFWKEFFVLGIVDPPDSFDLRRLDPKHPPPAPWTVQPASVDLLEALARDFARHRFSLKHLMRTFARSSAYQLSSRYEGRWKESYTPYFARKLVRMLSAEEIHDAISQATHIYESYKKPDYSYGGGAPQPRTVRFFTQLASPEELSGKNRGAIDFFLHSFGQSNREQFDRQSVGSIVQAMLLMNDDFVNSRVKVESGGLVAQLVRSDRPPAEVVEQLFLWTLARRPSERERALAVALLEKDRAQGAEDVQWSLINKLDFVFNY